MVRSACAGLLALLLTVTGSIMGARPAQAADTAAYIRFAAPLAQRETAQYGVPTSVSIAQSILESGWGGSKLSTEVNNYFGIKCKANSPSVYQTGCLAVSSLEYTPEGTPYPVVSEFRTYANPADSFLDHGQFLTTRSWYAPAFAYKDNPDQFIREVAKGGYATDPKYPDLVIDIMKRYNLYQYDATHDPKPSVADPGGFVALSPTRYLDTRASAPLGSNSGISLQIAGRNGIPADATAIALNLTVTRPQASGYLTAYATGGSSNASVLNFTAGQTVPNAAVAPVGQSGGVTIFNGSLGASHIVVDVTGYYRGSGGSRTAGSFVSVAPARVLDTRTTAAIGPGGTVTAQVGSLGSPMSAVAVNLTVTGPSQPGFVTAYPTGQAVPATSSVNFVPGQTLGNLAIVRTGADGSITLRNGSAAPVHVIVDVSGWFVGGTVTMRGGFVPAPTPERVLDTRAGIGYPGTVGANAAFGLDPRRTGAGAVAINMTVTQPAAAGYLTVWPADRTRPNASIVNFGAQETVSNFAQVRLSSTGGLSVGNVSPGTTQVVADLAGHYTG